MSAEAPRNSGTEEPIHTQRPDGGLSGFLRRFIGQPTPTIIQPPPGLKDFAAKLHQKVDDNLVTQRQRELELQRETTARLAVAAEGRAIAEQRQREFAEGHNTRKRESQKVLQDFQIAERLKYIQKNVWGGMGTIRQIDDGIVAYRGSSELLAGLELIYQYPACVGRKDYNSTDAGDWTSYMFAPEMRFTKLGVKVVNVKHDTNEDEKLLEIFSGIYSPAVHNGYSPFEIIAATEIPLGEENSVTLLEQVLLEEIDIRLNRGSLPKQLENGARRGLTKAKQSLGWQKPVNGSLPNLGFVYESYSGGLVLVG